MRRWQFFKMMAVLEEKEVGLWMRTNRMSWVRMMGYIHQITRTAVI
jgi:hypothetical protein